MLDDTWIYLFDMVFLLLHYVMCIVRNIRMYLNRVMQLT